MRAIQSLVSMTVLLIACVPVRASIGDQVQKLNPLDATSDELFGLSVSICGNEVLVGAVGDDENGARAGAAFLFDANNGAQIVKLLADDGAAEDDFGWSVALDGPLAVIGAPQDDDHGAGSGAAYVFASGVQVAKLVPADGASGDEFGYAVSVSGTVALVGAPGHGGQGAAYLFDTTSGQQLHKLVASTGSAGDRFGQAVSLDNGIAVIGAPDASGGGNAYVFDAVTGIQGPQLTAADGGSGDELGYAVSIDGTRVAVGAPGKGGGTGSAYLFDASTGDQLFELLVPGANSTDSIGFSIGISASAVVVGMDGNDQAPIVQSVFLFDIVSGNLVQTIEADDGAVEDWFGFAVAIDGARAVVGAFGDDDNGSDSGSAYVFDTTWAPAPPCAPTEVALLLASDGAGADEMGRSVGVSDSWAVVGAARDSDAGAESGAAYVYRFDGSQWIEDAKLLPGDGAANDWFGWAVAIEGDLAVATSYRNGLGYAFRHDGTQWTQEEKLIASDGSLSGRSVAIDQGRVVIGAPGRAYVFVHDGSQWFEEAKFVEGFAGDSVSISMNVIVVGDRFNDSAGSNAGAAVVYRHDGSQWNQETLLFASDGAADDEFGKSVAIAGDRIAVSAWADDDNGAYSGSVYAFEHDGSQWNETTKLTPSDGAPSGNFGWGLAMTHETILAGAFAAQDDGFFRGTAYVYRYDQVHWREEATLRASDRNPGDFFGFSVDVHDEVAVIGALRNDDLGPDSGSAYVFDLDCSDRCLNLSVENLVAGDRADFKIRGGTPGSNCITVYGRVEGTTSVTDRSGYCATFDIQGVNQNKVIGGFSRTFDGNGEVGFDLNIPANAVGLRVLIQSAERNTCPDECVSDLVDLVVQ